MWYAMYLVLKRSGRFFIIPHIILILNIAATAAVCKCPGGGANVGGMCLEILEMLQFLYRASIVAGAVYLCYQFLINKG